MLKPEEGDEKGDKVFGERSKQAGPYCKVVRVDSLYQIPYKFGHRFVAEINRRNAYYIQTCFFETNSSPGRLTVQIWSHICS